MFCSKCGKTLPPDAASCPFCGLKVGESRFEGSPYTSAQAHILPNDDVRGSFTQNYTRVNYTGAPEAAEQGDVDSRTTYRPTYDGDSIPEEMRRDINQAAEQGPDAPAEDADIPEGLSEEAASTLNAVRDELKMDQVDYSQFRARPIESAGQSGISSDVSEMMQELEAEDRRSSRRRRNASYGDYGDYEDASTGESAAEGTDQSEVFDDIDDEEFDELRHSSFGIKQIIRIVIVLIIVAALFVGGVMWLRYIRSNTTNTPIENVRETLYEDGVAMIKTHASSDYTKGILSQYQSASNGSLTQLSALLDASTAEVTALLPEDATDNEQTFMKALEQIQTNIVNCVITDAMAVSQNDAQAAADSNARWAIVENSIAMLEKATSAGELTAIINGEVVDIAQLEATPTPEPAVNYNTLSKGDKSDEVLQMQNRLYELGYLNDDRDGAFGTKTQTAVKMFQQVAGLPITGIADSDTLNALYAADAPRPDTAPTPTAEAAPSPTPEVTPEPTVEAAQ